MNLFRAVKIGKVLGVALLAAAFLAPQAKAEGIGGSWSGGGVVVYSDGHRERARCRAHYSQSGRYVSLSGVCATPSGSAEQTANLRQVGPNSYAGSFSNSQFGIEGSIHVSVHGNTQSVSLRGGGGSASLTMHH
ncbi:MAG: hypothetical protein ACLPX9_04895 [Rhodomicrobium sp.]